MQPGSHGFRLRLHPTPTLFNMKYTLAVLFIICNVAIAGPQTVPDTNITRFAENAFEAGNFSLTLSPGYAPKLGQGEWGLAVIGGYQATPYIGAFIRGDLFDNHFYIASGSATFSVPIKVKDNLYFVPLAEVGVGSVLSGNTSQKQEVFAIAGGGATLDWQINNSWSVYAGGVVETWEPVYSGVSMYRGIVGVKWTFK